PRRLEVVVARLDLSGFQREDLDLAARLQHAGTRLLEFDFLHAVGGQHGDLLAFQFVWHFDSPLVFLLRRHLNSARKAASKGSAASLKNASCVSSPIWMSAISVKPASQKGRAAAPIAR